MLQDPSPESMHSPPPPPPPAPAVWSQKAVFWVTVLTVFPAGFVLAAWNAHRLGLADRARRHARLAGVMLGLAALLFLLVDVAWDPLRQPAANAFANLIVLAPNIALGLYLKDAVAADVSAYRIQQDAVRDVRTRPWVQAALVGIAAGLVAGFVEYVILFALAFAVA